MVWGFVFFRHGLSLQLSLATLSLSSSGYLRLVGILLPQLPHAGIVSMGTPQCSQLCSLEGWGGGGGGGVRRFNFILAVTLSWHLQVDWPESLLSCCRSNDTEQRADVDLEMVNWPCSWQAVAAKRNQRNCWKLMIEFPSVRVRKGVWSWATPESLLRRSMQGS